MAQKSTAKKAAEAPSYYPVVTSQVLALAVNAAWYYLGGGDTLDEQTVVTVVAFIQAVAGLVAQKFTRSKKSLKEAETLKQRNPESL